MRPHTDAGLRPPAGIRRSTDARTLRAVNAETPEARLRAALEMAELGEQMVRARLRREFPNIGEEDLEAEVIRWRHHRPDAPHGDYPGPRSSRLLGPRA